MNTRSNPAILLAVAAMFAFSGCAVRQTYNTAAPARSGKILMCQASASDSDPYAAGVKAAERVRAQLAGAEPRAVLLAECFEGRAAKQKLLKGVYSVLPADRVFGFSTYGSFGQSGCLDRDAVGLLALAGDGIGVSAAIRRRLGIKGLTMEENQQLLADRLHTAGESLACELDRNDAQRLLILMADAHSPKNQYLVEGAQHIFGPQFPITGGSANKNAGQTFIYFQGRTYTDAAIALLLSGDFNVSLAGRQAQDNDAVIATAAQAADQAIQHSKGQPIGFLAFDCAGRKGKLDDITTELAAIQSKTGKTLPLFGCYCAGEIGPPDTTDANPNTLSAGVGWHVMFTVLSK